jgi:sulfoxide reductase heme-binding subunit YedZ
MGIFRLLSFILCLSPAVYLALGWWFGFLGANTTEDFIHQSGQWALFFLFLTLLVTPLTRHLPLVELNSMRRQWGLFFFFYAILHLIGYLVLDFFFEWEDIYYDIIENNYIIVGVLIIFLLLPLAITSTHKWRRKLKKRWQKLHRLVYLIFPLAMLHFYWLIKADYIEPILYTALIGLLLLERVIHFKKSKLQQ